MILFETEGWCPMLNVILIKGKLKEIPVLLAAIIYVIWRLNRELNFDHPIALTIESVINGGAMLLLTWWLSKKAVIKNWVEYTIFLIFIFYLYVLHTLVTYIPIEYFTTADYIGHFHVLYERMNLIPFYTIWQLISRTIYSPAYALQIIGNLILLTPFAFASLTLHIIPTPRKTIFVLCLVSIGIELEQFIETFVVSAFNYGEGRGTDIDDILLNTLGIIIGVGLYYIYNFIKNIGFKRPNHNQKN